MPTLTTDQARALASLRKSKGPRNPRRTIIAIQRLVMKDIENPKTSAAVRAKCVIAFDKLEDRLRILNNKPLPGHHRPEGGFQLGKRKTPPKGVAALPLPELITESEAISPSGDRSEATG